MTRWLNPTLLTCDHVGICFNEREFHRELRRMKVPAHQWSSWLTEGALATTHHLTSEKGNRASIVCTPIRKDWEGVEVAALLVHEAMHVLQEHFDYIGETAVGRETQAYAIQNISARLMAAYRDELFKQLEKDVKKDEAVKKEEEGTTLTNSCKIGIPMSGEHHDYRNLLHSKHC